MTEQRDDRLHDKESPGVKSLIEDWGWSYPKSEVIEMARISDGFDSQTDWERIKALNILSDDEVNEFEARAEDLSKKDFEWFSDRNQTIQRNRQRFFALSKRWPFYNIESQELVLHPLLKNPDNQFYNNCDSAEAILMVIQRKSAVLIFSDITRLKEYAHMGREEKLNDPIRKALALRDEKLYFAVGEKTQILSTLQGLKKGSSEVLEETSGDDIWYANDSTNEVQKLFARFFDEAIESMATDISITPLKQGGARLKMRLFGILQDGALLKQLSTVQVDELVRFLRIKSGASSDGSRIQLPEDGQFTYSSKSGDVYVRCSFIPTSRVRSDTDMVSASLRILPKKVERISLKSLSIDDQVVQTIEHALIRSQGLIVLAGPTNSGKSTTCGGMLGMHQDLFGSSLKRLTIEDPVERLYDGIHQIPVPAHLRDRDDKFAILMRAVLRHDPDVIMLGEVRDEPSAGTCIRAAASGHLVFTTLHANDAVTAWELLANYAHDKDRVNLARSLSLIISQRLAKKLCPHCKNNGQPLTEKEITRFKAYCQGEGVEMDPPETVSRVNAAGCSKCHGGYDGVYPFHELLPVTEQVKNLFIQKGADSNRKLYTLRTLTLMESVMKLVNQGKVGFEEIFV